VEYERPFVGVILIPIVGNAVEHVTAVSCALKGRMELSMGIAVGSGVQVALFVIPVTVLAGWGMGVDMDLHFRLFDVFVFMLTMIVLYAIVADGKGNWLEGVMLLICYTLIAIGYWFIPECDPTASNMLGTSMRTKGMAHHCPTPLDT